MVVLEDSEKVYLLYMCLDRDLFSELPVDLSTNRIARWLYRMTAGVYMQ